MALKTNHQSSKGKSEKENTVTPVKKRRRQKLTMPLIVTLTVALISCFGVVVVALLQLLPVYFPPTQISIPIQPAQSNKTPFPEPVPELPPNIFNAVPTTAPRSSIDLTIDMLNSRKKLVYGPVDGELPP
jgi:hypothetical protein